MKLMKLNNCELVDYQKYGGNCILPNSRVFIHCSGFMDLNRLEVGVLVGFNIS